MIKTGRQQAVRATEEMAENEEEVKKPRLKGRGLKEVTRVPVRYFWSRSGQQKRQLGGKAKGLCVLGLLEKGTG